MASVEKRTNTWRVVWREQGVKQTETLATEAAAQEFRRYVEAAGNRWPRGWIPGKGWADEQESNAPTLTEWAAVAIANRTRANDRTKADYLRDVDRHVQPRPIGKLAIDRITLTDVARWHAELDAAGLSHKTQANLHGLVSSIVDDAINHRPALTDHNPFKGALRTGPSVRLEEMVFLTPQEFESIARWMSDPYATLARLLVGTGLRYGEATALQVDDVNLFGRRKTLRVVRAWKRQPGSTYALGEPKSNRSRRTISLSPELVDLLIPFVAGKRSDELVIPAVYGGQLLNSTMHDIGWAPAVARAKVCDKHYAAQQLRGGKMPRLPKPCDCPGLLTKTPRIHDLRHTHVAWLVDDGRSPLAISRRLGHESITTTYDRYGHVMPHEDDQINAAVDRALKVRGSDRAENLSDRD